MAAGLGRLRLRPADFWSMTPTELAAALRGLGGPAVGDGTLPRAALAELMQRFPDHPPAPPGAATAIAPCRP